MTKGVERNVIYLQASDVDNCKPSIPDTLYNQLNVYFLHCSMHDKILDYYGSVYAECMNTTQQNNCCVWLEVDIFILSQRTAGVLFFSASVDVDMMQTYSLALHSTGNNAWVTITANN